MSRIWNDGILARHARLALWLRGMMVLWVVLGAAPGVALAHKLRVDDPAEARNILAHGGKLVADYGAFAILESEDGSTTAARAHVQPADHFDFIHLKAGSFSTRPAGSPLRTKRDDGFSGRRLHLVQFVGPVKPEWRLALEATRVEVLSYVPENAYLVYGDSDAVKRLESWAAVDPAVQWQGAYLGDYKLRPELKSALRARSPGASVPEPFEIQIAEDPEANAETLGLIDRWKVEPVRRDYEVSKCRNIVVALPPEALDEIAAQPDVISILPRRVPRKQDERQDQIVAGNLLGSAPSGPGYLGWLASKGFTQAQFTASGFVVDVSDSGIDNGTLKPGHFGLYRLGDVTGGSRVAYSRLVGFPNTNSTLKGCDGHGTLNAHVVAGYDDMSGFPHLDSAGYSYGLGVCPFVRVGSSVVFDPDYFTDPRPATLLTQAFNDGARISNNSWGASVQGEYDSDAQTYDTLVRDVGGGSGQRQMVIVFVAGNDGPGASTTPGIDSPGTAKNVITVGASENVRSLSIANGGNDSSGNDGCADPDSLASTAGNVCGFSSQGPCADGRFKPDLVAPGTHITGGVAQSGVATTNGVGSALPCFNASGVCALPGSGTTSNGDNFFPLNQEWFTVSTGTSHAGPAVSGACALLRQYFINQSLIPPSPAMTKAFLLNSARYLTGANANDTLWSKSQGMGELNLGTALDGVPRILRDQLGSDKFVAAGQQRMFAGVIPDSTRPMRVTLAWTDAAGSPTAARALVNDLDLAVSVNGNTYLGNVFSGANSVTGGTADSLNNVENVFLPAGSGTNFTVTVTAANIAADALLSGGNTPQQDFALVIYNAALTNLPPYVATADSYSGLFSQASVPSSEDSGSIALKTTARGAFTGVVQLGAKRYGFSGRLDSEGSASVSIKRASDTPLSVNLQVDTTDNSRVSGNVVGPGWVANLLAVRQVYNAKNNPAPFAGKYTLIIPGNGDPANTTSPQGDGYCAVTVAMSGRTSAAGVLADGTRISTAGTATAGDQWPLFASLYRGGGGCLMGWLNFAPAPQTDMAGPVTWNRQPDFNATFFAAGFTLQTNAVGSAYHPPVAGRTPIVSFTSGAVILSGGGLANAETNSITISAKNKILTGTNTLTMNFIAGQGLFSGIAVNPDSGARLPFRGAVLQKQNLGSGFFVAPTGYGKVWMGP